MKNFISKERFNSLKDFFKRNFFDLGFRQFYWMVFEIFFEVIFYKLKIIQTCKLLTCEVARRSAPWRQCSLQPGTSTTFSVSC